MLGPTVGGPAVRACFAWQAGVVLRKVIPRSLER
jgi:hypothetical protein